MYAKMKVLCWVEALFWLFSTSNIRLLNYSQDSDNSSMIFLSILMKWKWRGLNVFVLLPQKPKYSFEGITLYISYTQTHTQTRKHTHTDTHTRGVRERSSSVTSAMLWCFRQWRVFEIFNLILTLTYGHISIFQRVGKIGES